MLLMSFSELDAEILKQDVSHGGVEDLAEIRDSLESLGTLTARQIEQILRDSTQSGGRDSGRSVVVKASPLKDKSRLGGSGALENARDDDGRDLSGETDVESRLPEAEEQFENRVGDYERGERLSASVPASRTSSSFSTAPPADAILSRQAFPEHSAFVFRDGVLRPVEFWSDFKGIGVAPELRSPAIVVSALKASNFASDGLFTSGSRFVQRPNNVLDVTFEKTADGNERRVPSSNGFPDYIMLPPAIAWDKGDKRSKTTGRRTKQRPTFDPSWQYIGLG